MTGEQKSLWENVLGTVEKAITPANFKTWFKDTGIVRRDEGIIYVGTPNRMARDWIAEKYHSMILKSLRELDETVRNVEYTVAKVSAMKKLVAEKSPQNNASLPIDQLYVDKRDNLNPRYTFETFIVGPFNQLAHAAALAVLQNPALAYNPLFIYGSTGHGKTHLIQSVGNQFKKTYPSKKILYVTSEQFAVDYYNAVRSGRANQFKEKYRQYDVLIMDDVQFIADKERTQEELFHLFNYLFDNNKQIIFSSDKHPQALNGLEDRLRGRLGAGLTAEIPEPDTDSRISIIKEKLVQQNFVMSRENIEYIAKEVRGNIRELEGVLNSAICNANIKGRDLTLPEIRSIIQHNTRPTRSVSPEEVLRVVSQYYEIPESAIFEKTRKKDVVKPRQIAMFIMREDLGISYPSIGDRLGGRDHTTVIHSCEKIKDLLERDQTLVQEIEQIRVLLRG
ncbi:MAG: chromosomal replication initiator protein DnaA [Minisyncoccia bacterium]